MLQDRLELLLKAVKTNSGRLSDDLGRSHNYVHAILNGNNMNPDPSFFDYLQARYNVNIAWLRDGEGEMFGPEGMKNDHAASTLVKKINTMSPKHKEMMREFIEAILLKEEAERKA